jgi:hypothetical protein
MDKLLKAKEEIISEIDAVKSVPVADIVAEKVAEYAAQLTAEYEANNASQLAELEIGLKFIERAIARAEQEKAEIPAVEEVAAEEVAEVKAE